MAMSATGYGVVIDGILNIRTVTESANMAAYNTLHLSGFHVFSRCSGMDCDYKVKAMTLFMPTAKLVAVRVEVINV